MQNRSIAVTAALMVVAGTAGCSEESEARAGKERPDHCRQQDADDSGGVMHAIGVVGDHRDNVEADSNP
jgi:hypothetical protein